MLGFWRSHEQFQRRLEEKLLAFLPEHEKLIRFYAHILEKVYILNLDELLPLVSEMTHLKEGITLFVKRLRANLVLSAACGFEPDSVPGVGTFYDYLDRFWLVEEPSKGLRELRKKKSKKPKSGEKLPEEDTNRVTGLVNKVLEGCSFEGPETLLQKILTVCAVKPSLDLGLCGEGRKPVFAGDGTPLETGASHLGKKV